MLDEHKVNFEKWFGASKVVDENGQPQVMHHGSSAIFTAFDKSFLNVDDPRSEGPGFYFTSNRHTAEGYGSKGQVLDVFLSIENPLPFDAPPIKTSALHKFILRAAELEAAESGDDIRDGFLSNWGDTHSQAPALVAKQMAADLKREATALDQIGNLLGARVSIPVVNQAVREVLGFDGYVSKGFDNRGDAGGTIYVAMEPGQIKSVHNTGLFNKDDPDFNDGKILRAQNALDFLNGMAPEARMKP